MQPHRLPCEASLANTVVGLQFLNRRAIDDLALVDDGGVAGKSKAEMHVLLGDQRNPPIKSLAFIVVSQKLGCKLSVLEA